MFVDILSEILIYSEEKESEDRLDKHKPATGTRSGHPSRVRVARLCAAVWRRKAQRRGEIACPRLELTYFVQPA